MRVVFDINENILKPEMVSIKFFPTMTWSHTSPPQDQGPCYIVQLIMPSSWNELKVHVVTLQSPDIFEGDGTYWLIEIQFSLTFSKQSKLLLIFLTNRIDTYRKHREVTLWWNWKLCIHLHKCFLKILLFCTFPPVNDGLYSSADCNLNQLLQWEC